MQDNPGNLAVRNCPHCGNDIKKSAHLCPHCQESVAESDQREWEQTSPLPDPADADTSAIFSQLRVLLLSPLSLFGIIAIAFIVALAFYATAREKSGGISGEEFLESQTPPRMQQAPGKHYKPTQITTEPSTSSPISARSEISGVRTDEELEARRKQTIKNQERKQRIKSLSDEIVEELKREEAITPDTLYLKSGRQIQGTILEDLGTQWRVRYKGVTSIIEKDDVERLDRRAHQTIEMELRKAALSQAIRIVDEGLVRYGNEWLTPDERDLRVQIARATIETQKSAAQKGSGTTRARMTSQPVPRVPPVRVGRGISFGSVTINEGLGFGDIVVGHPRCTRTFIKSKLGQPDIEKQRDLNYDWKCGLRFTFATDKDMLIEISLSRRFAGKLRSGVSMASTMQDVFEAYGEPIEETEVDDLFMEYHNYANRTLYRKDLQSKMWYRDIGVVFLFEEDGIARVTIIRI